MPMPKFNTFSQASKVVALCAPPVLMALVGLAALSRKPTRPTVVADRRPKATQGAAQRPTRRLGKA